MSITRKIILAVGLILTASYLFMNDYVFTFPARVFFIFVASFVSIWGLSVLLSSMEMITKLHRNLNIIAKGNINYQAEAETSREVTDLAVSINEVGRKLRESADELEKRSILIERSNQELKRTEEHKSAYFSNIVHELRAPLVNIEKNSAVLLEKSSGAINAAQENFLKIINNNAKRLTRLTDDLLDISRMESGRLSIKYELVNVEDIINDALNSVDK